MKPSEPADNGHRHLPESTFDLKTYLNGQQDRVNRALDETLSTATSESRIVEAMRYSLMAGGKRLRPILCLAAADAVGKSDEGVLAAACALEMIHTYSLIHDDLPAMDDDGLRRGYPTCHVAFGEATAILTGDALLSFAFEMLSVTGIEHGKNPEMWLRIINMISRSSGFGGMIEGQMRDIASEGQVLSLEALEAVHTLKTGAIIRASVAAGAHLGRGTPEQIDQLDAYARNVGLAFQVTDDVLNVEGDPDLMGKAVGSDQSCKKNTYPSVVGVERAKAFAGKLVHNALHALDGFDIRADPLRAIAVYVIERKR